MGAHYYFKLLVLLFQVFALTGFAQSQKKLVSPPRHLLNVHYAFSYAADVELDADRKQRLPGFGYQYTSARNWYVGADVQYDRNKRPDYFLNPVSNTGFYTYLSSHIPGGIGYFTRLNSLPAFYTVRASDSIFATPFDKYPVERNLSSQRFNFFLYSGRLWEFKRFQIEAGLTFQATYFRSVVALTDLKFLPILVTEPFTGSGIIYDDGVRYIVRSDRSRFVPGGGFHFRVNYSLNRNFSIGVQALATGSEEGLFLQAAPRLVYSLSDR